MELATKIYIDQSNMEGAGRGVFARELIREGELIEACPIVTMHDEHDRHRLRKTGLVNYYFLWGAKRNLTAICLGWGSIYNHSFSPNARYEKHIEDERMDFYALRDIQPGEEIFVNYNGVPTDTRRLTIPGIPAAVGGPLPTRYPRPIAGIIRRAKLLALWMRGTASIMVVTPIASSLI